MATLRDLATGRERVKLSARQAELLEIFLRAAAGADNVGAAAATPAGVTQLSRADRRAEVAKFRREASTRGAVSTTWSIATNPVSPARGYCGTRSTIGAVEFRSANRGASPEAFSVDGAKAGASPATHTRRIAVVMQR